MNKLFRQMILTQQTHMHRFKGERAESNFLQHSARNQVIKHTGRQLQAALMCSLQGNKHVVQSTGFNMWTCNPVWDRKLKGTQASHNSKLQDSHRNPSFQSRSPNIEYKPTSLSAGEEATMTSWARELTHANTKPHWKNNTFYETLATPSEHFANFC